MTPYANQSGRSAVVAYCIEDNAIIVEFKGRRRYCYTDRSAGHANVEHMKQLARAGRGLGTFITRNLRDDYER